MSEAITKRSAPRTPLAPARAKPLRRSWAPRIARGFGRLVEAISALILLVILVACGLVWLTLPGGNQEIQVPGLSGRVDVALDSDGIPRIHAANDLDAAAALGFLHARERMFQMEAMRRAASGELSEVLGSATVSTDRLMRTLGLRRRAVEDLPLLPPDVRARLDAYARGVNAWIAERGALAGVEFLYLGAPRPWEPVDSLLWAKTMGLYLSENWRTERARAVLDAKMPPAAVDALWPDGGGPGRPDAAVSPGLDDVARRLASVVPSFPDPFTQPDEASNGWAVDGRRSATAAPLLAGDPHLAFGFPSIWYLARIQTPSGVLAGATAPGVPFLVLGHNGHIAWTFTTTGADTQDLFVEAQAGDGQYATPDGPRPFTVREEVIRVRGAAPLRILVRETRHGPVVSDLLGDPSAPVVALAAANLQPHDTASVGLAALNDAADIEAAGRAAGLISAPVQNLIVADRARIGLFVTGRVPVRAAGDGGRPVQGGDGKHDWTGFASGARLPQIIAPESGRIVNANDRVAPPDFPVFLGRDSFDDTRARRIRDMLDRPGGFTTADFAAMQLDTVDLFARDTIPRLAGVTAPDEISAKALQALRAWDANATRDGPQPLIFNAWMERFTRALFDRIGVPQEGRGAVAPWPLLMRRALGPEGAAWCGGDCVPLLRETLGQSVGELAARFGPDPTAWHWGDAHPAVFSHPLLRAPWLFPSFQAQIAAPGGDTTVNRAGMRPKGFEAVHGPSFRGVYDLSDLDRSLFVMAPGQSGHLFSRLAQNFLKRWRDGATVMLAPDSAAPAVKITMLPATGAPISSSP